VAGNARHHRCMPPELGAVALTSPRPWMSPFLRWQLQSIRQHQSQSTPVVHYFRSPKTGSSALLDQLHRSYSAGVRRRPQRVADVHEYELKCLSPSIASMRLHVHDHGGGCWGDVCNASSLRPGMTSFTVLREPCERFASVFDQLIFRRDSHLIAREMGGTHVINNVNGLVAFIEDMLAHCSGLDAECAIHAINGRIHGPSRVFFYPQALFVAAQPGSVVCYDSRELGKRLDSFLARRTSCTVGESPAQAREHLSHRLPASEWNRSATWKLFTGLRRRNVHSVQVWRGSGERLPGGAAADLAPAPSAKAATSATDMTAQGCQRILRLYARDAKLWATHCSASDG